MKTIIAGSRSVTWDQFVKAMDLCPWTDQITTVISGGAKGADKYGALWAHQRGLDIQIFQAEWQKYGKAAGPMRNSKMADNAEALIAVWDGKSRGTKNMIGIAQKRGLKVFYLDTSTGEDYCVKCNCPKS
jgi:hypothetical protein